jgi:hypothetical protein
MIDDSIAKAVNDTVGKIQDAIEKRPLMKRGFNHDVDFKIKDTDQGFDKLLRLAYAFKDHAKADGFKKQIDKESELWKSKKKLVDSFNDPRHSVKLNTFDGKQARDAKTPTSQVTTEKQFIAVKSLMEKLKDLTDSGYNVPVKYIEDYAQNKGKPIKRTHQKNIVYNVKFIGDPVFDTDSNKVIGGSIQLQVGDKAEKGKKVKKNMITIVQNSNDVFPNINIATAIFLPFVNANASVSEDLYELDAASRKRAEIRNKNRNISAKKVLQKLDEDFLKLERASKKEESDSFVDEMAREDEKQNKQDEKEQQERNEVQKRGTQDHINDEVTDIIPEEYTENPMRSIYAKSLSSNIKNYENGVYSKNDLDKLGKNIMETLEVDSAEELIQVLNIYKEAGVLDNNLPIEDFSMEALETVCKN